MRLFRSRRRRAGTLTRADVDALLREHGAIVTPDAPDDEAELALAKLERRKLKAEQQARMRFWTSGEFTVPDDDDSEHVE